MSWKDPVLFLGSWPVDQASGSPTPRRPVRHPLPAFVVEDTPRGRELQARSSATSATAAR